jgi:DNA polymerase-4
MSIDEVACRLDRVQQDPAVAQKLAQSIKHQIRSEVGECLTSSIGISANKLLAKMASNMQKPDGLTILPMEKLPGAVLHLNIRAIPGIGPKMAEHLQRSGITDMATLWNTDAARLRVGRRRRGQDARASAWRRHRKPEDRASEHQPSARVGARRQKH